jgi:hypothetical protein
MVGHDLSNPISIVNMNTASQTHQRGRYRIDRLFALGEVREDVLVIGHQLPPSATVDALLGLDFFRQRVLTLDFVQGQITLI